MLNCVPLAITSFRKFPHWRLTPIYSRANILSSHFPAQFRESEPNQPPWRAVFMGTPAFVVPTLEILADSPLVDVVAVYTTPDRRRGRGQTVEATPIKSRAVELGIPVVQPRTLRDEDAVAELQAWEPHVVVVAAYGRFLPPEALALPRFGCLNLHPSLLPRHRGPSPVAGAILAGDEATGITLMLLDEGMDTGPIIAQLSRPLESDQNAESLTAALFEDGASLLMETLPKWIEGSISAELQDDGLATYTEKLERADGLVDWRLDAETLGRRLRAYTPWPGLHTRWGGKELKILEAAPSAGESAEPGQVISRLPEGIGIGAGSGLLVVRRLQLEGRRATDAAEFLRGYPQFGNARLD